MSSTLKNSFPGLPVEVFDVINSAIFTEFATMTVKGVPINSPTFCFIAPDGRSVDMATGLAYPAKAERARRNPKVGLLIEGPPGTPVVSIAAIAAVRDSDFQANADRYIAETAAYLHLSGGYGNSWSVMRNAVWYWTRIFILCTPQRILWWPNREHTDAQPRRWNAPANSTYPASDPAPAGAPSSPATWPVSVWNERAKESLDQGINGHLTLIDDEGFPLPFRTRSASLAGNGFDLDIPAGAPWKLQGSGTLCFAGRDTFVGDIETTNRGTHFVVERILPTLPMVKDPKEVYEPSPSTRTALMARLEKELVRRGQQIPTIFEELPPPTSGSVIRAASTARLMEEMALKHMPSSS